MPIITYDIIKQAAQGGGSVFNAPGQPVEQSVQGQFTGEVVIEVPPLPTIDFPMEDLTFGSQITGQSADLDGLLGIKSGAGGKVNNYGGKGSQILINSDRIILNTKTDYLMLFGQSGVAISSQGNVNIDAEESVTLYGEDGVFIGVPGKGVASRDKAVPPKTKADPTIDTDYEPLVLGLKLANLLEDLLIVLKNATIIAPLGEAAFREDVMYEFRCLQARIPEMLSTYAYVDGISHEAPDPGPEPPKTVTEPSRTLRGTVTGTFTGTSGPPDPNTPTQRINNPMSEQPDFYETETLY